MASAASMAGLPAAMRKMSPIFISLGSTIITPPDARRCRR